MANVSFLCVQHCCAKLKLPTPHKSLASSTESVRVLIEGVAHCARKPSTSVAVDWKEAIPFSYPPLKESVGCEGEVAMVTLDTECSWQERRTSGDEFHHTFAFIAFQWLLWTWHIHSCQFFDQPKKRKAQAISRLLQRLMSLSSLNGACGHYIMVSKFQWKPFWLATQRDPQNDWTATQNRVSYDVFAQAPFYLEKHTFQISTC